MKTKVEVQHYSNGSFTSLYFGVALFQVLLQAGFSAQSCPLSGLTSPRQNQKPSFKVQAVHVHGAKAHVFSLRVEKSPSNRTFLPRSVINKLRFVKKNINDGARPPVAPGQQERPGRVESQQPPVSTLTSARMQREFTQPAVETTAQR